MSSLGLAFEGFAQIRLATDPDPADEPRGVGGWTHAVAGEPDLDRVLVLHEDDPRRVARSHGPSADVTVRSVIVDGTAALPHPLVGARVDLLDAPKFEGRNWIIAGDGAEPIDPVHLRISGAGVVLEKRDIVSGPDGAEIPFYRIPPDVLARRMPQMQTDQTAQAEVFTALGVPDSDPVAWRAQRKKTLLDELASPGVAQDVMRSTALRTRILDLELGGPAVGTVGVRMLYRFALHGPGNASDAQGILPGTPQVDDDWPLEFWVGGWDADAFCMFMRGTLTVPLG